MTSLTGMTLTFATLIKQYKDLQSALVQSVRSLVSKGSQINPGSFIMLQFQMANVAQMGESISNLISQLNTIISHAITNQKVQ